MTDQQPWPDISPSEYADVVDRRPPGWIWAVFAGWLVLVGGWMPVLVLVSAHRKGWPGAGLSLSLAGIGVAGTVVFGFVLGRWVPRISSWAKIGCAAPVGCLSWVFWFAIAYAIPIAGVDVDPSEDDSGALGAIILGPFVLLLIIVLLGLGVGIGVARLTRTTNRAE